MSDIFTNIILFIGCFGLIWSCVSLVRNNIVYNYRRDLAERVSELATDDILHNREWEWRYEVLMSVGYHEMVNKPWRTLDSFYPDKSFIKTGVKKSDKN